VASMNDRAAERPARPRTPELLRGGGQTGELIASFDWSRTPLGPIEGWPQSLRTATAILLHSPVPLVMLWGEHGIMIYNDAYSVFAAGRHPRLLGSKVREGWPEVADFNDHVMKVGLAGGTLSSMRAESRAVFWPSSSRQQRRCVPKQGCGKAKSGSERWSVPRPM
jgi:hypothetical protein